MNNFKNEYLDEKLKTWKRELVREKGLIIKYREKLNDLERIAREKKLH